MPRHPGTPNGEGSTTGGDGHPSSATDGEVARWYWISGTELVAVTTDRRQDGGRFVEAFATHTL